MKIEEILKQQGITEDEITKITTSMKNNKIYITDIENVTEEYNKMKGEKENAEEQLKTANTTIADLKKNNTGNETLQKKIQEHEDTIKTLKIDSENKVKELTINSAISNLLRDNNAKHLDLLSSQFNKEKLNITEKGEVIGLADQLKSIKAQYKDLFGEKISGIEPDNKGKSPENNNADSKTSFLNIIAENQAIRN